MESFPSSFLSSFSLSNLPVTPPPAPPSNYPPLLRISAVRIEEKPPTTTPTSTTRTPPPQPSRSRPIPSPYPPKITPISTKQPTPPPSFATTVFNAFDDIINTFIDPPIRPSVDPKHVLAGNFAPVDELPPTECTVVSGTLPPSLHGAYIRNGPNPQFFPRGPYHLFDGDGMLHAIKISDGGATLCSRYVKTYKFTLERKTGSPVLPNFFYGFNGLAASMARGALSAVRILTGMFDPSNGIGLANTSLVFFGNKLYALADSDLPYAIKVTEDGDIVTLGRRDFDGKLFMSMTSHPKIDGETGETFAFRYGPIRPFLTFFRFDSEGRKAADVPVFSMRTPSLVHDFAITKKYAVFVDIQLDMNLMEMMFGSGSLVRANRGKIPRIGVIPRYAKDESDMRWFEVPGFNILHAINAWDEDSGDVVVMVAPNILSVEHAFERMDLIHASVEKVRIDLKTGFVSRHPVASRNLDFAVINPKYMGKKNRYIYAAIGDPLPKISGVVKLDLSMSESDRCDCTVATRIFGPGCYGGEPFYVAKEPDNPEAEEDDGYLVTYVHNENTGESSFLVMDAKSPNLDTVAAVKLPRRVPYGLHGLFVTETDLNKLKTYGQQHMA